MWTAKLFFRHLFSDITVSAVLPVPSIAWIFDVDEGFAEVKNSQFLSHCVFSATDQ